MGLNVSVKRKLTVVVYRERGELHYLRVHPDVPSSVIGTSAEVFKVSADPTPNEEHLFVGVEQMAKAEARARGLENIHGLTC